MNTQEMLAEYEVLGFSYGTCAVRRKVDGVVGSLLFERDETTGERRYYAWMEG